jgi:hypothetical protein
MLQGIAAVAPVPRPEDVGIDAICTLLESAAAPSRSLLARETFAVQLKASSVPYQELKPQEVEWLLRLELPLFIGVVSIATAELRLHTLNNLVQHLHLTQAAKYPNGIAIELVLGSYSGPNRSVHVGAPVACWTLSEAKDRRDTIVAVMRKWCELEQLNLRLRSLDSGEFYRWESNCSPERLGGFYSSAGTERAIEALKRPVETLALAGLSRPDREQQWRFWRPLIEFLDLNGQLSPGSLVAWDLKAQAFLQDQKK